MKSSLAVSYKIKHTLIQPRNSSPKYLPKRNENVFPYKGWHVNADSCFIHNSQKMETTKKSIDWQMDKQNVIYQYNRILLCNKQEQTANRWNNVDETQHHYAK